MFILKCTLCGREQIIKKRLDKYTYSLLTQNNGLLCGCKDCDSYSNYKTPKGKSIIVELFCKFNSKVIN